MENHENAIRARLGEPYLLTAYQNMRLAKDIKTTQASQNITLWQQGFSQRNAKKNQPDVNNSVQIHTTLFSSFISASQRYRLSNVRS